MGPLLGLSGGFGGRLTLVRLGAWPGQRSDAAGLHAHAHPDGSRSSAVIYVCVSEWAPDQPR